MAGEIRTGVVITADAKGFDEALQKILKVNDTTLKGMKEQAKSYDEAQAKILGLEGQIGKLAKTQATLFETMAGVKDKSSVAYKAMSESLKQVQEQSGELEGAVKNLEKAYAAEARAAKDLNRAEEQLTRTEERRQQAAAQTKDREDQKRQAAEEKARWAFSQGFAQTATPWAAPLFLQRGPGFWRQAAGQATGALARGAFNRATAFGGAVAQAPFQGAQGLASMIGALPLPGAGILGGVMGQATGYAGRAIEWRRQQLEALPYVGGGLEFAQAREAAGAQYGRDVTMAKRYRAATTSEAAFSKMRPKILEGILVGNPELAAGVAIRRGTDQYLPPSLKHSPYARAIRAQMEEGPANQQMTSIEMNLRAQGSKQYEMDVKEAGQTRARTVDAARRRYQGPVYYAQREGLQFGMSKDQALQSMVAMIRAGGGTGQEFMRQGMMQTGLAAQTYFGVGPEVSGAFLQAGRRGGLVGGPGQADQMMTRALADGLKLGLEGSELVDYMQSMAEGIKQWESTGIPIAPDAIKSMAESFSMAGISGTRAAQMARGAASYVQGIGARGPQGGLDLMLLRTMGGYTGKGGAAEYEQAVIQMEELGGKLREGGVGAIGADKGLAETMRQITEMGGGGATGRFFLRSVLGKQMGIQMSQKEVGLLEKQLTGAQLTPEEQKYVDAEAARRAEGEGRAGVIATPKGLVGAAKKAVTPELRAQAAIQNQQIAAGEKMMGMVNQMDKAAVDLVKAFANLAGDNGILLKLVKQFEAFGAAMEKTTGKEGVSFGDIWAAGKMSLGLN